MKTILATVLLITATSLMGQAPKYGKGTIPHSAAATHATASQPTATASPSSSPAPHSAAVDKPSPTLSIETKSEIQTIIIKRQNVALQKAELEKQYKGLSDSDAALQQQAAEAQVKALKGIGLDPEKYEVQLKGDGSVVAVEKPKAEEKK